ncbi:MAG: GDP-mannose 4,6-dehydratase, partial [Myxococcota bacterium]
MAGRAIEKGELVCVTGASGYIGSHVVEALLRRGYRVRGTVRDATAADKTAHLKKIAEDTGGSLELVSADLTKAGAFD